ncbi:hypothetical protein A8O16_12635 [Sphingobium sp. 20006FA]|nr:hypothetical protein [Sphingobium sp. AM]OAP31452.1 hypothetical protein A8O16_12635 [Sphingobium sp. 20006FA]
MIFNAIIADTDLFGNLRIGHAFQPVHQENAASLVVKRPQITRKRFIRLGEDFLDFWFIAHLGAPARPYEGAASGNKQNQTAAVGEPILCTDQEHSQQYDHRRGQLRKVESVTTFAPAPRR